MRNIPLLALASLVVLSPLASHAAPWVQTKKQNGIAYFLFDDLPRIERFDLTAETFLSAIVLPDIPTAFEVSDDAIFVGFGRRVSRFTISGTNETHLKNTTTDVEHLWATGGALIITFEANYYLEDTFLSVNSSTGATIQSVDYGAMMGQSFGYSTGRVFGRSSGISPSDIRRVVINPDGTLGGQIESPYHGDYPSAQRVYVFPNEARVADDSGIVYNASNLTYSNSLAGSFTDLDFYGDLPIVLRTGTLHAYSNVFLETGTYTPATAPEKIYVHGETIYSFFGTGKGSNISAEAIPVSLLTPDEPGEPVDPTGVAYTPDEIFLGTDDVVYILSIPLLSVFRYDVWAGEYLESIPLVDAPSFMSYSPDLHRLYLAYPSGEITKIDLGLSLDEVPFVNSPLPPLGLSTAGEYLFVCDATGAWVSHFTYDPDGMLISQEEWNYFSTEYVWSDALRKMYFFRDDSSPNDLLWEDIGLDGVLGTKIDSPYHTSSGWLHPIRVHPDGSIVIVGSGRIHNATTLVQVDSLSNNVADVIWVNGIPITYRVIDGDTFHIQRWNGANYAIVATRILDGSPLRLFSLYDAILAIHSSVDGIPVFTIYDINLDVAPTLTDEEMRDAFEALDANDDGFISPNEAGVTTGNFNAYDTNGDGKISYMELLEYGAGPAGDVTDVWVSFSATGAQLGTQAQPFDTLLEGANFVAPGGNVHIAPGITPETITISGPMRLQTNGGTVIIGQLGP